jgi:hypothetical protein
LPAEKKMLAQAFDTEWLRGCKLQAHTQALTGIEQQEQDNNPLRRRACILLFVKERILVARK